MEPSNVKRRLTCILAADAVGYSKQMGQDEEGTIHVLQAHRAVIDGIIAFHHGRIVSTAGDSVLAEFSSAVEAVRCAVEIQDALKTRNDSLPDHRKMLFRVGVNLGDVVINNDDLLGDGVNVAARLESMAEPGGICIASSVYDQITGKLDLGFQDIGQQNLKNISRPIHVYRVSGTVPVIRAALQATQPQSPPPSKTGSPTQARGPLVWTLGALAVLAMGAVVAWQSGWVRFGAPATTGATSTSAAPMPAADQSAPSKARSDAPNAVPAKTDADAQRLLADAKAIKREAEAELARARSGAQANLTVKPKAVAAVEPTGKVAPVAVAPVARDAPAMPVVQTPMPVVPAVVDKPNPAPVAAVGRFNGRWNVIVNCPKHEDGASGYRLSFAVEVMDGVLRGENGTQGEPDSLLMQGDIQSDGSALLRVIGRTGDPRYAIQRAAKGSPYAYQVEARFAGSHGTGRRLQLRPCQLSFDKQ
jgi:class 3 adenylate cyclase